MDEQRVYDKLEDLTISQATLLERSAQHDKDHIEIIDHLKRTNGEVADLREDFDEKSVEDAEDRGHLQGTLDTIRIIMALTFAFITVVGIVGGIIFGVVNLL